MVKPSLFAFLSLFVFLPCHADTLAQYANQCNIETGISVPDLNCDDPTFSAVPITNKSADGNLCDRPNQLNDNCLSDGRFKKIVAGDAFVVMNCRHNLGAPSNLYHDVAVIQHNQKTGATCFYQAFDVNTVLPAPSKAVSSTPWWSPADTARINCVRCHDNGPLIRSPYLTQVTGVNALPNTQTGYTNKLAPYYFVGSDFAHWKSSTIEVPGNSCISCHRLGTSNMASTSAQGTARDLGLRAAQASYSPHKNPVSASSPMWMPPGATAFSSWWLQQAQDVANCSYNIGTSGWFTSSTCNARQFTGPVVNLANWASDTQLGWYWATQHWLVGDFNLDGVPDLAKSFGEGGLADIDVHINDGYGHFRLARWVTRSGSFDDSQKWMVGDFNGDGRSEFVKISTTAGTTSFDVYVNYGAGNMPMVNWGHSTFSSAEKWLVGDFNGDKKSDLVAVVFDGVSNADFKVYLSNGSSFDAQGDWRGGINQGGFWGSQQWFAGDFDGDGTTDLANLFNDNWQATIDVHTSTRASFNFARWATRQGSYWDGQRWFVGDMNGDGVADLGKAFNDANGLTIIDAHLSNRTSMTMHRWVTSSGNFYNGQQWLTGDFLRRKQSIVLGVGGDSYQATVNAYVPLRP